MNQPKTESLFNESLANQRGLTDAHKSLLQEAYVHLEGVLARPEMFAETPSRAVEIVEGLEYHIQQLWDFDPDRTKHRYWCRLKFCSCPTLDNDELFGTGMRRINYSCPYHGDVRVETWGEFEELTGG